MTSQERKLGYLLALSSVLLVTLAQLLLKSGVITLPPIILSLDAICAIPATPGALTGLMLLLFGVLGYLGSLLCWLGALRYLPLHRAYPLLALSYGLVYLCAITLPWLHESITLPKSLGVLCIIVGVYLSQPVRHKRATRE